MPSLKIVCRGGMRSLQTNFEARAHSLHNLLGVIIQSFPRLTIRSFIWNDAGNWYGSWALGLTESSCSYNFAIDSPCNISNPSDSSAADEISGETVAIKLVTRVFEKIQFAKRALREITLLRHFSNHANITGLIDVDAISPDFSEM